MINTLKIYEELSQTLDQASAHKLASILGLIYEDLQNTVTKTDFRVLDDSVRGLTEAEKRTSERLDQVTSGLERLAEAQARTEHSLGQLASAQQRTEQRLDALAAQVGELAAAQQRTEQRLGDLAEAQQRMTVQIGELTGVVQRHHDRLGRLDGRYVEFEVRDKAPAYFGGLLKRTRVLPVNHLEERLEAILSEAELADLYRLDRLVAGRARQLPEAPEILVAVEISVTLDSDDIERAGGRAAVLRKAGLATVAAVAGERADPAVLELAGARGVAVFCNGHHHHWHAALSHALGVAR